MKLGPAFGARGGTSPGGLPPVDALWSPQRSALVRRLTNPWRWPCPIAAARSIISDARVLMVTEDVPW